MHPETARGENFNRNLQNPFFFSSFFGGLGRILRSWEQWVDDCSVSLKVDQSLNLRLQLRQKIRKLFVVRKSSSAVRSHRSGSSCRQFLRRTTDEQCRTTTRCWTGVGASNPKQLLLLPRRHSDLVLYNPFFTFSFSLLAEFSWPLVDRRSLTLGFCRLGPERVTYMIWRAESLRSESWFILNFPLHLQW